MASNVGIESKLLMLDKELHSILNLLKGMEGVIKSRILIRRQEPAKILFKTSDNKKLELQAR